MAQMVKNLHAMQETRVQSLGWEDPLEGRAWQPTPVFLSGESHGQRSLPGYSPRGSQRVRCNWRDWEWMHACIHEILKIVVSWFLFKFQELTRRIQMYSLDLLKKNKRKNSSNRPVYTFLCVMCVNSCSVLFPAHYYISNYWENTKTGIWEPFLQHKVVALCFLTCLLNDLVFSEEQKPFKNTEEI